nr:uncharacterized protein LOC115492413 isoform X2 [Taeniopygia guttata]
MNPGSDVEHRPASVPKLAWGKEEKEGPGAAPAQQPEEVEQFQLPQKGAAVQRTREQERTRGRFRRTAQMVCRVMKRIREEESSVMGTVVRAYSPIFKTKASAALLDMLVEEGPSSPKQATVVMWKILQLPCVPQMVTVYFPRLFVHLLFQVFFSTLDMPEEVDTFWKGCQQQHGLATNPSRFAVRTLKSLLCQMQHEDVVVAMERKCGWDTLLCADTHHYAVGLLAREMSCVSIPLCSRIARYLLRLLSTQEPRWELPSLAFLVEGLECLDLSERGADRVLQILSRHLRSECKERRHLVLRALLELIKDPSMREKMWSLTESLVELLWDADGEIVSMTAMLLNFIILDKDMLIASPITLQLVEALLPLLDHDNSQVQLLSILLF